MQEKIDKLWVFHYHGDLDSPITLGSVIALNEASWVKEGFKHYQFVIEAGLGHDISKKGFDRGNEFIKKAIIEEDS